MGGIRCAQTPFYSPPDSIPHMPAAGQSGQSNLNALVLRQDNLKTFVVGMLSDSMTVCTNKIAFGNLGENPIDMNHYQCGRI